jgi:hypothetical protein
MTLLTILILQIVGLLTYPPLLASIFSGKNIIKFLDDIKCDTAGSEPGTTGVCKQIKNYKWSMMTIMILYILAIVFYSVALFFRGRDPKVAKILQMVGGILSIVGVITLVITIISMMHTADKILNCIDQPQPCTKEDSSGMKYLWFVCSLTIIFSLIAGIMGILTRV